MGVDLAELDARSSARACYSWGQNWRDKERQPATGQLPLCLRLTVSTPPARNSVPADRLVRREGLQQSVFRLPLRCRPV